MKEVENNDQAKVSKKQRINKIAKNLLLLFGGIIICTMFANHVNHTFETTNVKKVRVHIFVVAAYHLLPYLNPIFPFIVALAIISGFIFIATYDF